MVDPALRGLYPPKSLSRFADIIALCVQVTITPLPLFTKTFHQENIVDIYIFKFPNEVEVAH